MGVILLTPLTDTMAKVAETITRAWVNAFNYMCID